MYDVICELDDRDVVWPHRFFAESNANSAAREMAQTHQGHLAVVLDVGNGFKRTFETKVV